MDRGIRGLSCAEDGRQCISGNDVQSGKGPNGENKAVADYTKDA